MIQSTRDFGSYSFTLLWDLGSLNGKDITQYITKYCGILQHTILPSTNSETICLLGSYFLHNCTLHHDSNRNNSRQE